MYFEAVSASQTLVCKPVLGERATNLVHALMVFDIDFKYNKTLYGLKTQYTQSLNFKILTMVLRNEYWITGILAYIQLFS